MLEPIGKEPPTIKIKRFYTDQDSTVNDWLKEMRLKIKVLDIQVSPAVTICIIYQSFTGEENES